MSRIRIKCGKTAFHEFDFADRFEPGIHISMDTYFDQHEEQRDIEKIVLRFKNDIRHRIGDQKYYMGFAEERMIGNELEMTFFSDYSCSFAHWILSFGKELNHIYPEHLKERVVSLVSELNQHYLQS